MVAFIFVSPIVASGLLVNATVTPPPRMEKSFELLREAQIFPTLNTNYRYCQIKMEDKDMDEAVYVTHHGSLK